MKSNLESEISRLESDPRFAARTASLVRSRVRKRRVVRGTLAAACMMLAAMVLFRYSSDPLPGLHTEASAILAEQETSSAVWEDTDSVIAGALASR